MVCVITNISTICYLARYFSRHVSKDNNNLFLKHTLGYFEVYCTMFFIGSYSSEKNTDHNLRQRTHGFTVRIRRQLVIILSLKISQHLATTENKRTSITTHFKKLTTGNNVFIVSVIVSCNCQ